MTRTREPIMQGGDGEVKPDLAIEIYRSMLHGHWMVRWGLHEYATEFANTTPAAEVAAYMEWVSYGKVKVME